MHLPRYDLITDDFVTFSFYSEGPKGRVEKVVQFTPVDQNNIYNLSLCDRNPVTGELEDNIVTNNGDKNKVLSTTVGAIYSFCNHFPDAWIYVKGSSASRTRLYRMGINKFYEQADKDFIIFGETLTGWEPYQQNAPYEAFLVQTKNTTFGL